MLTLIFEFFELNNLILQLETLPNIKICYNFKLNNYHTNDYTYDTKSFMALLIYFIILFLGYSSYFERYI